MFVNTGVSAHGKDPPKSQTLQEASVNKTGAGHSAIFVALSGGSLIFVTFCEISAPSLHSPAVRGTIISDLQISRIQLFTPLRSVRNGRPQFLPF